MNKDEKIKAVINNINILLEKNGKSQIKDLTRDYNLIEDFEFDSLDLAELTVRIEDDIGIDIFENDIINTTNEIISQIRS